MVFFPRELVSNTSINGSSIGLNRKKEVFIERLRYPLVLLYLSHEASIFFCFSPLHFLRTHSL